MTNHVRKYMRYFGYGEQDVILCECCGLVAVDIHHIKYRSRGGTDDIENLMAVCRKCHDLAHNEKLSESEMQFIHNNFLNGNNKQFIK